MDNKTNDAATLELLREMAAVQRKNQRLSLIATVVILLTAAALIVSLALVVPKLSGMLEHARSTFADTRQTIQRFNSSLDRLDSIGAQLEEMTGEGTENLEKLIAGLNTLDLDALTQSIQRFNSLLEGFASFSLFG